MNDDFVKELDTASDLLNQANGDIESAKARMVLKIQTGPGLLELSNMACDIFTNFVRLYDLQFNGHAPQNARLHAEAFQLGVKTIQKWCAERIIELERENHGV